MAVIPGETKMDKKAYKKAYRIIRRYTYNHELAHGFPTYESADAYNRKHFLKDETFGPEGRVEEYDGVPFRNEQGLIEE